MGQKSTQLEGGYGASVLVGTDPIVGMENKLYLSQSLVDYLHDFGLKTLEHVRIGCNFLTFGSYWISTRDMDMSGEWFAE